jgi:anti-sigma regulatory factor (Ser/Thr protein kinase)
VERKTELVLPARVESWDEVLAQLEVCLEDADPRLLGHLALAAEEIFVNIALYAYAEGEGQVWVRFYWSEEQIVLEFQDNGAAYNPLAKADPDITLSAQDRAVGGLGVYLAKRLTDRVVYCRQGDANILRVEKRLRPAGGCARP